MEFFDKLLMLEERLWNLRLSKTKKIYLSAQDIQDKMRNNASIPTSMFNATKSDYIVKSNDIYESSLIKKRVKRW